MTRLTVIDIQSIQDELANYDGILLQQTGRPLFGIACHANEIEEQCARERIDAARFAVIPMTCGEGIISTFTETIVATLRHLGCNAAETWHTDSSGIAEAFETRSTHLIMADDHSFIALDLIRRSVCDNALATGSVFAAGLALMVSGLRGKPILVIGCGPVGEGAACKALSYQAKVTLFDINRNRCLSLAQRLQSRCGSKVFTTDCLSSSLRDHRLIIDATNAAGIIDDAVITSDTFISAPGMPLGLTKAARRSIGKRLLHDPLQLGVAAMAVNVAAV